MRVTYYIAVFVIQSMYKELLGNNSQEFIYGQFHMAQQNWGIQSQMDTKIERGEV